MAWTCLRLIDLGMAFYTNSEHQKVRNSLNDMIVPTAMRCLKLIVLVAAVCCEVSLIGNGEWLAKLLAGMGPIGLAASLAAQDTLKNFFGTLLLIGEHPFKMGDLIVVNDLEGIVESVGFRSTRIRTADDFTDNDSQLRDYKHIDRESGSSQDSPLPLSCVVTV